MSNKSLQLPLWARIAIAICVIGFLLTHFAGKGASSETKEATQTEQVEQMEEITKDEAAPDLEEEQPQEPVAQVFENDLAKAEFLKMKDVDPYFFVDFMVTNKTGQDIVISGSEVLVNDAVNVRANGGSSILAPIEPGKSGVASLSVAYEYAGVSSVDDVRTVSGAIVLNDESLHEIGTLPFSITVSD